MRFTFDIDEHVLKALVERALSEGRSPGELLSELARRAVSATTDRREDDDAAPFLGFQPLPRRGAVISNDFVKLLRESE